MYFKEYIDQCKNSLFLPLEQLKKICNTIPDSHLHDMDEESDSDILKLPELQSRNKNDETTEEVGIESDANISPSDANNTQTMRILRKVMQ